MDHSTPASTQPTPPPLPPSTTHPIQIPTSSQNPNPNPQASTAPLHPKPQLNRPRPPSQFSPHIPSRPSAAPPATTSTQQAGLGLARAPFSTYQQQQYAPLARNPTSISDSKNAQVKQLSLQATIGNFGSLSGSPPRPGGLSSLNQPRPHPSLIRQPPPINHHQRFQSHAQPWLSSPTQAKQVHPPYRQPIRPQRPHYSQQQAHPTSALSHQQLKSSQQESPLPEFHQKEIHARQHPGTRVPQPVLPEQQAQRGVGLGNQNSPTTTAQPGVHAGPANNVENVDAGESTTHILSKRSIHELLSQIDPSEKLDPEVEDILIEMAEDFVDSITTVGCSLAKHRKSTTLEAKDILLHLEKNWNMTLPGFGGDDLKGYKKQLTNDIHKERLVAVKKSMVGSDIKSISGQAAGNIKSHVAKAHITGSPKGGEIS